MARGSRAGDTGPGQQLPPPCPLCPCAQGLVGGCTSHLVCSGELGKSRDEHNCSLGSRPRGEWPGLPGGSGAHGALSHLLCSRSPVSPLGLGMSPQDTAGDQHREAIPVIWKTPSTWGDAQRLETQASVPEDLARQLGTEMQTTGSLEGAGAGAGQGGPQWARLPPRPGLPGAPPGPPPLGPPPPCWPHDHPSLGGLLSERRRRGKIPELE